MYISAVDAAQFFSLLVSLLVFICHFTCYLSPVIRFMVFTSARQYFSGPHIHHVHSTTPFNVGVIIVNHTIVSWQSMGMKSTIWALLWMRSHRHRRCFCLARGCARMCVCVFGVFAFLSDAFYHKLLSYVCGRIDALLPLPPPFSLLLLTDMYLFIGRW